jgi:hypothetical protein
MAAIERHFGRNQGMSFSTMAYFKKTRPVKLGSTGL